MYMPPNQRENREGRERPSIDPLFGGAVVTPQSVASVAVVKQTEFMVAMESVPDSTLPLGRAPNFVHMPQCEYLLLI